MKVSKLIEILQTMPPDKDIHNLDGCGNPVPSLHVWAIEANGYLGGGVAIVASETLDTAIQVAGEIKGDCNAKYHTPDKVTKLQCDAIGSTRVLGFYEWYE